MIVSYGFKFISIGFVLTILVILLAAAKDSRVAFIISLILAVLTVFLTYFYRNPIRHIPKDDSVILSIADGEVLSVENIENNYIGGKGKKVSIFLSIFDVHINRIPVSGRLDYVKYNPGKFFAAFKDKASTDNENTEIGMKFSAGKMIFKQIAGILARRIEYDSKPNQQVQGGEIFGMIHFGSRAELFLPDNIEVTVKKGDKVKAGVSVIGRIINNMESPN
jgi:phosphatidylserine decarboxylase